MARGQHKPWLARCMGPEHESGNSAMTSTR
jgi:hypothetical protein